MWRHGVGAVTMSKIVEAVYENGVFRPLEPVALVEGEHVRVHLPELTPSLQERLAALDAFEQESEDFTDAQWHVFDEAVERRPWFGGRQLEL
jgi:predicted DNA-binding antitoxin AbrB/MazE fold protein